MKETSRLTPEDTQNIGMTGNGQELMPRRTTRISCTKKMGSW